MKHIYLYLALPFFICSSRGLHAQSFMAPQPLNYNVVNQSGATPNQIVDTMYAHANTADTVEGGQMDELSIFKAIWQNRAVLMNK